MHRFAFECFKQWNSMKHFVSFCMCVELYVELSANLQIFFLKFDHPEEKGHILITIVLHFLTSWHQFSATFNPHHIQFIHKSYLSAISISLKYELMWFLSTYLIFFNDVTKQIDWKFRNCCSFKWLKFWNSEFVICVALLQLFFLSFFIGNSFATDYSIIVISIKSLSLIHFVAYASCDRYKCLFLL